jgi:hypothetical protein
LFVWRSGPNCGSKLDPSESYGYNELPFAFHFAGISLLCDLPIIFYLDVLSCQNSLGWFPYHGLNGHQDCNTQALDLFTRIYCHVSLVLLAAIE